MKRGVTEQESKRAHRREQVEVEVRELTDESELEEVEEEIKKSIS